MTFWIRASCSSSGKRDTASCRDTRKEYTVHPGNGLRRKGRGIRRVTWDTLSQRECSLVTIQSYWKKFLCVPSTEEISCTVIPCFSTPCPDMVASIYGRRGIPGLRPSITNYRGFFGLCWFVLLFFSWGIFLVLFPFFNLGNDRWSRKREETEKWK